MQAKLSKEKADTCLRHMNVQQVSIEAALHLTMWPAFKPAYWLDACVSDALLCFAGLHSQAGVANCCIQGSFAQNTHKCKCLYALTFLPALYLVFQSMNRFPALQNSVSTGWSSAFN